MRATTCIALLAYLVSNAAYAQEAGTIDVDIAIVGGGATGAYAAVRLREDFNKTVVVIEKQNRLVCLMRDAPDHLVETSY